MRNDEILHSAYVIGNLRLPWYKILLSLSVSAQIIIVLLVTYLMFLRSHGSKAALFFLFFHTSETCRPLVMSNA